MKIIAKEFIRYVLVGGTAFIADFAALLFLTEIAGTHYLLSATLAFLLGTAINYALSTQWVFSVRTVSNRINEFTIFATIGLAGVLLNAGLIALQVETLNAHYAIAKLVAAGLILFFNFGMRKWLLFSSFTALEMQHDAFQATPSRDTTTI